MDYLISPSDGLIINKKHWWGNIHMLKLSFSINHFCSVQPHRVTTSNNVCVVFFRIKIKLKIVVKHLTCLSCIMSAAVPWTLIFTQTKNNTGNLWSVDTDNGMLWNCGQVVVFYQRRCYIEHIVLSGSSVLIYMVSVSIPPAGIEITQA